MASVIHLDTHVVVWLYAGDPTRLRPIRETLSSNDLTISPIVMLELQYLFESGRTHPDAESFFADLSIRFGLTVSTSPYLDVARRALRLDWTRDPFDRLIVAHSLCDRARLLTCDRTIRAHCPTAFWN